MVILQVPESAGLFRREGLLLFPPLSSDQIQTSLPVPKRPSSKKAPRASVKIKSLAPPKPKLKKPSVRKAATLASNKKSSLSNPCTSSTDQGSEINHIACESISNSGKSKSLMDVQPNQARPVICKAYPPNVTKAILSQPIAEVPFSDSNCNTINNNPPQRSRPVAGVSFSNLNLDTTNNDQPQPPFVVTKPTSRFIHPVTSITTHLQKPSNHQQDVRTHHPGNSPINYFPIIASNNQQFHLASGPQATSHALKIKPLGTTDKKHNTASASMHTKPVSNPIQNLSMVECQRGTTLVFTANNYKQPTTLNARTQFRLAQIKRAAEGLQEIKTLDNLNISIAENSTTSLEVQPTRSQEKKGTSPGLPNPVINLTDLNKVLDNLSIKYTKPSHSASSE
ncbi:hypothetical protein Pst134EA_005013 [Puccinia striiformis f. sp. tritici]|uniref:hypothetical protein n=1 Tax=Puccinia striiformis f. sp. tritici TaxID=168172 RepID=UPI0020073528|nr:hypothetical protein Pst134EA_005013 [Puccinia striiformis f. sp. tritici]KAH9471105.1 hypothetical protein Pst134EA_005013 [Puccinia striiformis f. sp. tritici]